MKPILDSLHNERGMSMMEIMIVLVLVGLMASLAVPSFIGQMPRLETQAQAKEIVSKLREARSLAIARKEPAGVCIDQANNQWTIFLDNNPSDDVHNTGDSSVVCGAIGDRLTVSFNTFSNHDVIFYPDGSCSQTGSLCLISNDYTLTYTVDVLASTGRIRLREGNFAFDIVNN